jgi:hypothetical protein
MQPACCHPLPSTYLVQPVLLQGRPSLSPPLSLRSSSPGLTLLLPPLCSQLLLLLLPLLLLPPLLHLRVHSSSMP